MNEEEVKIFGGKRKDWFSRSFCYTPDMRFILRDPRPIAKCHFSIGYKSVSWKFHPSYFSRCWSNNMLYSLWATKWGSSLNLLTRGWGYAGPTSNTNPSAGVLSLDTCRVVGAIPNSTRGENQMRFAYRTAEPDRHSTLFSHSWNYSVKNHSIRTFFGRTWRSYVFFK